LLLTKVQYSVLKKQDKILDGILEVALMARIAEAIIGRLKREVSLLALVEAAGIALKRHGKDYLGLCSLHDDKEPSLVISPEKNLWHCLGTCGEGGDVIAWVMKREGVSFRHAVELLQQNHPALAAKVPHPNAAPAQLTGTFERPAGDQALLAQMIDFYHETLEVRRPVCKRTRRCSR
jgi:DNA primase